MKSDEVVKFLFNERQIKLQALREDPVPWSKVDNYEEFKKFEEIDVKKNIVFHYPEGNKDILYDEATFYTYFVSLNADEDFTKKLNVVLMSELPNYPDFALSLIRTMILKDNLLCTLIAEDLSEDKSQVANLSQYLRHLYSTGETSSTNEDLFQIEESMREYIDTDESLTKRYIKTQYYILFSLETFREDKKYDISRVIQNVVEMGILDVNSSYYKKLQKIRRQNLFIFLIFCRKTRELLVFFCKNKDYVKAETFGPKYLKWIQKINRNLILDGSCKFYDNNTQLSSSREISYLLSPQEEEKEFELNANPGEIFNEIYEEEYDSTAEDLDEINYVQMDLFEQQKREEDFVFTLEKEEQEEKVDDEFADLEINPAHLDVVTIKPIQKENSIEEPDEFEFIEEEPESRTSLAKINNQISILNNKLSELWGFSDQIISKFIQHIESITSGGIEGIYDLVEQIPVEYDKLKEIYEILQSAGEELAKK